MSIKNKLLSLLLLFLFIFMGDIFYNFFINNEKELFQTYKFGFLFSSFMFSLFIISFFVAIFFANNKELVNFFGFSFKLKDLAFCTTILIIFSYLLFENYLAEEIMFYSSEVKQRENEIKKTNSFLFSESKENQPGMRQFPMQEIKK